MSNAQQQQQRASGPSYAATMNAFSLVARTWATSVEVLLHKRVGDRYLGGVAVARLDVVSRKRNGVRIHSFYSGYPRCMNARTKMSELQCKRYFEPLYVASIGLGLYLLGEHPLGVYLMIAGACMFLSVSMAVMEFEQRAAAMNDQVIEQEYIAERFREMRGDQF